jgi:chemotaxis protein MotB
MGRQKQQNKAAGAPEWMVTYGDMMTLLLCFFVMLLSMSVIKKDEQFNQVVQSIRQAFGYESSTHSMPGDMDPVNSMVQELQAIIIPPYESREGDTTEEGIEGRVRKVTDIREGIEIVVGGRITFERFSAVLKPMAEERIARVSELIRGKNTKIIVRGHATREPLPEDSLYEDPLDLSYQRAKAVAEALENSGVRRERIAIEAVGHREPLKGQAYTEQRRAANRRVEIIVTEALLSDFAGEAITDEEEVTFDAG